MGFTLVEIVVIIGVMSILALLIVPNITAYLGRADDAKIQSNLKSFHTAAETVDKTGLKYEEDGYKKEVGDFANMPSEEEFNKYHFSKSSEGIITVTYNGEGSINHGYNGTGTPGKTNISAPGPSSLVAGTKSAGYYGIVSSDEFISGNELAKRIGLTAGTAMNSNEGWLKMSIEGKTIYKSKKSFRHSASWDSINAVGAVYGNKEITIDDNRYRVRLIKGASTNDTGGRANGAVMHDSEWNRLILPLHETSKSGSWVYKENISKTGVPKNWGINLSNSELSVGHSGSGTAQLTQSFKDRNSNSIILRGYNAVDYSSMETHLSSSTQSFLGWSPVLELIE